MIARICFLIVGSMIFLQANYWAGYTTTDSGVVMTWGLIGAMMFATSLIGVRRHG